MKGHIRKRGDNTWAVVIEHPPDPSGKRRQKWHTVHGTKKDAERECIRLLHELETGVYVGTPKIKLCDYLRQWMENYAQPNVSRKTYERYEQIIRIHLVPSLGQIELSKLKPLDIQRHYSTTLKSGRHDGKGGLSAQTVLHHHRVLREALAQAVKWQLIPRNPADAVEPPRPRSKEMKVLDEAQLGKLLKIAKGTTYYVPIVLAVTTGMRRGEILALRWSDVDLEKGNLSISQTLEHTNQGYAFKEPKTRTGRRSIALPSLTVDVLLKHRQEQEMLPDVQPDLVFCRPDGSPWDPSAMYRGFVKILNKGGLPRVRFHDLRHSHATQLLQHGIHAKVVSERLGHSTIGITLDVYSHILPSMQEDAARTLDSALRNAIESKKSDD